MNDSRLEIILAAKDLTGRAFDHVQGRLMALERRVFSLGSAFAGFGLGFGVSQLAGHAEKTAEGFEQLEAQLDILYRGNGKKVLEEINAWALDMPINTQKAVDAFVQMKALGLDPTLDRLQVLTDVAVIFGDDVLKRIVLQLGQMSAKGKVMAQDLNVLAESGINARKYIMDAFGMTVEEIQDSGTEISRVVEVLFKGMERDFGGSAQRMMTSWRGLKETAESYFVEIERRVMDAGVFTAMKGGLSDVNDQMKTWLSQNDALLKQKVPEYTNQVIESVKGLVSSTQTVIGIYSALPEEITGAAGYGIMGRILFGGWGPAKFIAGIAIINNGLSNFGLGLGDVASRGKEAKDASQEFGKVFVEVLSGERHWWTGEYNEWKKAAETATDFWQRHKKGAEDYQSDIGKILENDPLSDFFARQKNQMGYYTSTAGKLVRQIAQEDAKAAEEAKAAAKKLAEDLKKAREEFATALMGPSRLEEFTAGGQSENAILRMETERIARIREEAKAKYGESSDDWISRHREEIGPYRADLVKENLEMIRRQTEDEFDGLVQLSERTAKAMQENFSDLFFDAMTGELKSFEDYATAVFRSFQRALADIAGQMATEGLFGSKAVGNKAGGSGGLIPWLIGLLGSSPALEKHAGGAVDGTGPTRMIPAWMIASAPRLHGGLAPDEFAAVLQRGETVKAKGDTGSEIHVHNHYYSANGRYDRESTTAAEAATFAALARAARRNN